MEASTALMSLFVPQISQYGIMDEEAEDDEQLGTPSSSSSSCCDSGSLSSSSSELADDATSKLDQISSQGGPYEMASLMAELPFKRGLSRHFQGKSQSFTSLASVRCVEDLVKPERPQYCRKKLKYSCRSYAAGLDSQRPRSSPTLINGCSKAISKRPAGSRGARRRRRGREEITWVPGGQRRRRKAPPWLHRQVRQLLRSDTSSFCVI